MAGKPGRHTDRHRYNRCAFLFSMTGKWPISRVQRGNAKAYDGCPTNPPPPPEGMTELDIARVNELLQKRGWSLITQPDGKLVPIRQL